MATGLVELTPPGRVPGRFRAADQAIDGLAALAAAARCCPAGLLDHVTYDAADDDACVLVAERIR